MMEIKLKKENKAKAKKPQTISYKKALQGQLIDSMFDSGS